MSRKRMTRKTVGTRMLEGLREFADALKSDKSSIPEKFTCHTIKLHLRPSQYTPDDVRETRRLLNVSQALFAEFLGVSVKTVQAWEQDVNPPNSAACRLMDDVRRRPEHWKQVLAELVVEAAEME